MVQVGESLEQLTTTLQSITIALLFITPFVLLLSAFGSYWLATRALRPIHRLTLSARNIKAGDLHRRVPVPQTKDEVQALALTFNEMIGRLDRAFTQQRRFVADASHELRTPVTVIRNIMEVALAQPLNLEDTAHIFERFYRADPARSRSAGGSGLGLAIVDWVVRAHAGSITVESQVGQGSIFKVILPMVVSKSV